jgi:hypothetical protein
MNNSSRTSATARSSSPPRSTFQQLIILVAACVWLAGSPSFAVEPLALVGSFEAIKDTGWTPCDPIIAAGPESLVTMVNSKIVIFTKTGAKLFEQNLSGSTGFWSAQAASATVGEPWVIFDPNSGRFMAIATDHGNAKGFIYLAISKTSTPTGTADWHKYRMDLTGTHQVSDFLGQPTFPQFPKLGVDGDATYITSVHFAKDPSILRFSHAEIIAIEKAPLLSGGPLNVVYDEPVIMDEATRFFSIQPAIVFEPAPAMYFVQALGRVPAQEIVVHALADVLTAPVRITSPVPVAPFDRPPNVPQHGSAILLGNIDARLSSTIVRNGSLWTSHAVTDSTVDAEAAVRWYEFDITGLPTATATLVQSGNVDPGTGIHTWMPSINVDADGNMGLVFSVGGASQYAAIGYTGRRAGDASGTTLPMQTARAGAGPYTGSGWGIYSGLAIDPDGSTFWLFHEYPTKFKTWQTFVGAFQVGAGAPPPPAADPLHSGDLDGSSANSGKNWRATVVVSIHDGNHNPVQGATVFVQWSGGTSGTANATSDANGQCTFTSSAISKSSPSATLSITSLTHATLIYSAAANHDPDGDSSGTSITITKP